jgi:hypothetical protein
MRIQTATAVSVPEREELDSRIDSEEVSDVVSSKCARDLSFDLPEMTILTYGGDDRW